MAKARKKKKRESTPEEVAYVLIRKYGAEHVVAALKGDVEDAKLTEANPINEGGADDQVRYLMEQAGYTGGAVERIVEEHRP